MSEPVSTTLFLAAAATKAAGALSSGLSEAGQSRAQAHLYDAKAVTDAQASALQEDAVRRQGRRDLGEQIAERAQSGGGLGGSNGLVLDQSATDAAMKALAGRWQGTGQVTDDLNQSLFARAKARSQTQGAFLSAFESALNSANQMAGG